MTTRIIGRWVYRVAVAACFVIVGYVCLVCAGCFIYGDLGPPEGKYPWWMP